MSMFCCFIFIYFLLDNALLNNYKWLSTSEDTIQTHTKRLKKQTQTKRLKTFFFKPSANWHMDKVIPIFSALPSLQTFLLLSYVMNKILDKHNHQRSSFFSMPCKFGTNFPTMSAVFLLHPLLNLSLSF